MIEDVTTKIDLKKEPVTNSFSGKGGTVEDATTMVDLKRDPITLSYERKAGGVEDGTTTVPLKEKPVRGWTGPGGAFPEKSPSR